MSYETTKKALGTLNRELRDRYEEGRSPRLSVTGKPKLHILSFNPVAYEEYGFLRNRAPLVAGSFALRAFLSAPHPTGGALLFAGVEAGTEGYGFVIDVYNDAACQAINNIACELGHENFKLSPA